MRLRSRSYKRARLTNSTLNSYANQLIVWSRPCYCCQRVQPYTAAVFGNCCCCCCGGGGGGGGAGGGGGGAGGAGRGGGGGSPPAMTMSDWCLNTELRSCLDASLSPCPLLLLRGSEVQSNSGGRASEGRQLNYSNAPATFRLRSLRSRQYSGEGILIVESATTLGQRFGYGHGCANNVSSTGGKAVWSWSALERFRVNLNASMPQRASKNRTVHHHGHNGHPGRSHQVAVANRCSD